VEWTSNRIIGLGEVILTGTTFPTNVTEASRLTVGPKLRDLKGSKNIRKAAVSWFIEKLKNWNDD
jgi:hypothetical protein